ncbi:MAG: exonuclease SbcCD subunit D [Clostridia bacterium]|nr:exonuclease SbcCD subunit D [Clostridia bacterium]
MLKIIHTADIHLDSPFRMEDLQKAQARKIELRAAFSSLMFWAKTEQADIMLIAGDLFDSPHPTPDAVEFVVSQFASNPNCRFIISPGNHDFAASDSVYAKTTFPENVSVFTSQTLSCLHFDNIAGHAVDVYGYAFTSPILDHNPFAGVTIPQSDTITLLCGHGTLGADNGKDCPIKTEDIVRSGFDYVALGHIHNNPGIQKIENTYYGYSGSLEPRAFNDRGERGAFLSECDKKDGTFTCRPAFFRLCKRIYAVESVNLTGASTKEEVLGKINALVRQKGFGKDTLLRLTLEGSLAGHLDISSIGIESITSGLYYCELRDHTSPDYDLDALQNDPTIKGELVRTLMPLLESEDENRRILAARALKYALSALSGNDISDFN